MRRSVALFRPAERSALELARRSQAALDRALTAEAEVAISVVDDDALVLGAFQRGRGTRGGVELVRRGSGGPEVLVGPGTIHLEVALANVAALPLPPSSPSRIVNRAVRPLLRALTRRGYSASFFGRDWVSVTHQPAAWVGFAHDAGTQRALFEAFVAVATPFAVAERGSFAGKSPSTLEKIAGRPVDLRRLVDAIVEAYAEGQDAFTLEAPPVEEATLHAETDLRADPPWAATVEEAIGLVGAGPDAEGVFRIGGDLLVSRDALAGLASAVDAAPSPLANDDVDCLVDRALARPEVALDGVRSLKCFREVILRALPTRASP
jgi:hypothetical protein